MSKKVKVIGLIVVVIILLTVGGTTVAMANEEETVTAPREWMNSPFLARVAEILGISTDNLTGAVIQAWQEMREGNLVQATANCTICQEKINRFREQWKERQQKWAEKRQEMGRRFQGSNTDTQNKTRLRISQSVRGRQMIAAPKDGAAH